MSTPMCKTGERVGGGFAGHRSGDGGGGRLLQPVGPTHDLRRPSRHGLGTGGLKRCRQSRTVYWFLIAITTSPIFTINTTSAETVITRMARRSPSSLQRLTEGIGPGLTSSVRLNQLYEIPVPPSEFDAAVSGAPNLADLRGLLNRGLKNDEWKKTCDGAAWHLLTFFRHLKHKSIDDWRALRRGNPEDIQGYESKTAGNIKEDFREIMEIYDDKCLESPTLDALTANDRATGVLLDGNVPYCTVTRVSQYHILTARHCLFRRGQERRYTITAFLDNPDRKWTMSRLSQGTDNKNIASLVQRGDRYFRNPKLRDAWDFDILEVTKGSLSGATTPFASSDAKTGETIRVLAHNNYVRAYLHIVNGSAPSWQTAMRFDTQQSCRAQLFKYSNEEHNQACLIHGCQTAPSGSGAAVLQHGKIVAVHINENGEKGCASALEFLGNRGVRKWTGFEKFRSAVLDGEKRHLQSSSGSP